MLDCDGNPIEPLQVDETFDWHVIPDSSFIVSAQVARATINDRQMLATINEIFVYLTQ